MSTRDPYAVLGISPQATDAEVKAAYHEMARKYHPDNYTDNPLSDLAQEKMQEINEAYDTIVRMRQNGGGGYSGNYDRYMESKQSYRSSKSPECKQRLMENLEQYMDDFSQRMEEMLRDSDCQEERATIKRYIDKIKNIN